MYTEMSISSNSLKAPDIDLTIYVVFVSKQVDCVVVMDMTTAIAGGS